MLARVMLSKPPCLLFPCKGKGRRPPPLSSKGPTHGETGPSSHTDQCPRSFPAKITYKPEQLQNTYFSGIEDPPGQGKLNGRRKMLTQRSRGVSLTACVFARAQMSETFFFTAHLFPRRSPSGSRLPTAPLGPASSGSRAAAVQASAPPACARAPPAAPGRLRPATGQGARPRGRTPAAQLRRDSSLLQNFPPENPCTRTSPPPRGGFDFSSFPSFYFLSCTGFGLGANLQLVRVHVRGNRPCSRFPCHHALRNRRIQRRYEFDFSGWGWGAAAQSRGGLWRKGVAGGSRCEF